jgi:hypothetical protein
MEGPTTFPRGVMRYARVSNRPLGDVTLIVESQGPVFDVDGRYLHTAWTVIEGATCNRFYEPGDRVILGEDRLVPLVRVNWHRIAG